MVTTFSNIWNAPGQADQVSEKQVRLPFGAGLVGYLGDPNGILLVIDNLAGQDAERNLAEILAELHRPWQALVTGKMETSGQTVERSLAEIRTEFYRPWQALEFGTLENLVAGVVANIDTGLLIAQEGTGLGHQPHSMVSLAATDAALARDPYSREPSLDHLATQLRIDVSLLLAVRSVLQEYVVQHPHLVLTVEPLTDPEVAGPIEAVFEIQGTRSSEETERVWEEAEEVLQGAMWSEGERQAILEKVAVHVHRAPS